MRPDLVAGDVEQRTVDMPQLWLRAELGTVDEEERTVEVVFSTGAAVERLDWATGQRYLEKLSMDPAHVRMDRINAGAPVCDTHSTYSVRDMLGAVVPGSAKIQKKQGRALLRFSRRPDMEGVWQDVKDHIVRNVSMGYKVYKVEETKPARDNAMPVRNAVDWEPWEISMVPMGADAGASTRSEPARGAATNPCLIVTRQEDAMAEGAQNDNPQPTPNPPPAPPAPTRSAPPPSPTAEELRAAGALAERDRADGIRRAVRAAGLDAEDGDDLVQRGLSIDAARAEILDKLAARHAPALPKPGPGRLEPGEDEADKWRRGAGAWVINKAGVAELIRAAVKAKPDHAAFSGLSLDPGEFRGMTLMELARASLERAGQSTRGLDKLSIASLALRGVTGMNTTSDFTVALENVLNKVLLASYTIVPDTWRRFCSVGSVTDFRPHPRYRTGFLNRLDVVEEGGEFKNKQIPDAVKESISAKTKGNMLTLSRQAIVNDDMGVFNRVAAQAGRAAALSIEMDVYDLLALNAGLGPTMNDGQTLFHATHNNIGTGSALTVAGLDADRVVMASQKDPANNEILDLRPATLVIAIGLGGQARVINQSQYDTDIVANKFLVPNKVVGLFNDIVDTPRLAGTRRYLFTDPAQMPVIEVAFLEGVQEPFLEMREGWRVDGVEWKIRHDWGVAAVEFRGAVTNAGV